MKKFFIAALLLTMSAFVFAQSNATDVKNTSDATNSGVGQTLNAGSSSSHATSLVFPSNIPGAVAGNGCLTSGTHSWGAGWNLGYNADIVQLWSKECAFPADVDLYMKTCQFYTAKVMMDNNARTQHGVNPEDEYDSKEEYKKAIRAKYKNLSFEECVMLKNPPAAGPKPVVEVKAAPVVVPVPVTVVPVPVAASAPAPKIEKVVQREIVHTRALRLDSLTLFDTAKYDLTSKGKAAIAKAMVEFDPKKVIVLDVEGRTDDVGTISYNQELSLKRAASVALELRNLGFMVTKVTGYGKEKPIVAGTSAGARAVNRSVTITVQESSTTVVSSTSGEVVP